MSSYQATRWPGRPRRAARSARSASSRVLARSCSDRAGPAMPAATGSRFPVSAAKLAATDWIRRAACSGSPCPGSTAYTRRPILATAAPA